MYFFETRGLSSVCHIHHALNPRAVAGVRGEIDAMTARGSALNASAVALDIVCGVALTAGASWTIADWLKRGRADRRLALTSGWPAQRAGRAKVD
jgi:hypothetical protein